MTRRIGLVPLALVLCAAGPPIVPVQTVAAAKIAAGVPVLVNSVADPSFALINARVDIGMLRQVGDAIETELAWTLTLGALNDTRAAHPGVSIPDGSASISRERIVCSAGGALSYAVETRIVAPDGKLLDRRAYDAEAERRKAEEQERAFARLSGARGGYGSDPRSLVCWAAARKCEGRDFTWPPPPNNAPLEYSARATAMRNDYNARFVPGCALSR